MQIGVAYSEPGQQIWLNIEVPDESTVADGIERSGILAGRVPWFPGRDAPTHEDRKLS